MTEIGQLSFSEFKQRPVFCHILSVRYAAVFGHVALVCDDPRQKHVAEMGHCILLFFVVP